MLTAFYESIKKRVDRQRNYCISSFKEKNVPPECSLVYVDSNVFLNLFMNRKCKEFKIDEGERAFLFFNEADKNGTELYTSTLTKKQVSNALYKNGLNQIPGYINECLDFMDENIRVVYVDLNDYDVKSEDLIHLDVAKGIGVDVFVTYDFELHGEVEKAGLTPLVPENFLGISPRCDFCDECRKDLGPVILLSKKQVFGEA